MEEAKEDDLQTIKNRLKKYAKNHEALRVSMSHFVKKG